MVEQSTLMAAIRVCGWLGAGGLMAAGLFAAVMQTALGPPPQSDPAPTELLRDVAALDGQVLDEDVSRAGSDPLSTADAAPPAGSPARAVAVSLRSGTEAEPARTATAPASAILAEAEALIRAADGDRSAIRPATQPLSPAIPTLSGLRPVARTASLAALHPQDLPATDDTTPDHAPATGPAGIVAPADCVSELQTIAARTRIYFDPSSAELDRRGAATAMMFASLVRDCEDAQVTVLGFTDPKGDPEINLALSWQRARNVVHGIKSAGFETGRFAAMSHMEDHPDHCEHFDIVDRRVEFEVKQTSDPAAHHAHDGHDH